MSQRVLPGSAVLPVDAEAQPHPLLHVSAYLGKTQACAATVALHEAAGVAHLGDVLGYVKAGTVSFDVDGPLVAPAGRLVLIPAGTPHRPLGMQGADYMTLGFCASCLGFDASHPLMAPFARVRRGSVPVLAVPEAERDWVSQLFERLHVEFQERRRGGFDAQCALLRLLLLEVQRACAASTQAAVTPEAPAAGSLVERALTFIGAHALEPISLKDVAAACHCTPSHLATRVKRATGYAVGAWITSVRLSTAAGWLQHSDASLDEIATRVGWGDTTHFIRQFKKRHGITPAAWRKHVRAGGQGLSR